MAKFVSLGTMAATRVRGEEATGQGQRRGTLNGHLRIKDCWVWKSEWKSKCPEKRNRESERRRKVHDRGRWTKERWYPLHDDCSQSLLKTISKKIYLTFFLSFRNPPRFSYHYEILSPLPPLLSRSISLFNFHDRATRFHRESSSFPLPPSSRLALCNEKCARNRYFLLSLHPCFSSFCVYSVWKKKLREKFRGRISQDGKPLFKYEQESDLVFNSSN